MKNSDIFEKDQKYIVHTYNRFSAAIKSGYGAQAEDYEGKKYIDFGSGIGTNSLGFCNDKWVQAVVSQVKQLQHTSNLFYTLQDSILAERLCKITGYSKVFFGNSGAEANEGAIKRFLPQGRIYSTRVSFRLQKVSIMFRQMTAGHCMKL